MQININKEIDDANDFREIKAMAESKEVEDVKESKHAVFS